MDLTGTTQLQTFHSVPSSLEASPTTLTLERQILRMDMGADDQLTFVQRQVSQLEQNLALQGMQATRYIAEQREHYTGRAYEILREQRTEFETQAIAYQEMAREVATNELQQQRLTLDATHQQQMSRIASHVIHEEALARGRLLEVDNQLATTAANAQTVEAHAEDFVRANHNLEEQLVAARGAV